MAHKTVWLIRHGKTRGNAQRRFVGRGTDEPLSEEGIREARMRREKAEENPNWPRAPLRVCSSPMRRAVQTAEILFDRPEFTRIEDLAELDFGLFEGKNHAELAGDPSYQAWLDSNGSLPVPGGEDLESFGRRSFRGFLEALGDPLQKERVAVVCHGGSIMAVMSTLTGEDYYTFIADNLSGYCLEIEMNDEGICNFTYHGYDSRAPR